MIRAKDIMSKAYKIIDINDKYSKVINAFSKSNTSCFIVRDKKLDNHVVGIITERGLLKKLLKGKKPTKIKEIINTKVRVMSPKEDISTLYKTLKKDKATHLAIAQESKIIGIISQDQIMDAVHQLQKSNRTFLIYQDIQTGIILLLLIFILVTLFLKMI